MISSRILPAVNEKLSSMARSAMTSRRERQCETMEKEECLSVPRLPTDSVAASPSKSAMMFLSFNVSR